MRFRAKRRGSWSWPPSACSCSAALAGWAGSGGAVVNAPVAHLVVNEVDYDNVGTDTQEFIEIFNGTGTSVPLADYAVVLVNGGNNLEYSRTMLAAAGTCLAAGRYLVIADKAVVPDPNALVIRFPGARDQIQNGQPDGVALIDTSTQTLVDALSYEGSITKAQIEGFPGLVSLVEGTPTPLSDSNTRQGVALPRAERHGHGECGNATGRSTARRPASPTLRAARSVGVPRGGCGATATAASATTRHLRHLRRLHLRHRHRLRHLRLHHRRLHRHHRHHRRHHRLHRQRAAGCRVSSAYRFKQPRGASVPGAAKWVAFAARARGEWAVSSGKALGPARTSRRASE